MKTLRLLLLGLLTPLLFSGVFAFDLTNDDLNYIKGVSLSSGNVSTSLTNIQLYDHGSTWSSNTSLCVLFYNYTAENSDAYLLFPANGTNPSTPSATNFIGSVSTPYNLTCITTNRRYLNFAKYYSNGGNYSFTYYVLNAKDIFNGKLGFDITGLTTQLSACNTNLSTCQSDLSTANSSLSSCQSDLSTANSSLSSCQSDLSSCQNNGSNCDTLVGVCQENLSGCMADKSSLQNYNEALSTQLNECLNNQGTGSTLSGFILNNNSLFRYLDDSLLSLPINNNLFLPLGYQGALDSGNVLYIKAIDEDEPENYYITPEDKISIIDILSYVFVFFLGIGVIFSLIKLFKKLFTH